MLHAVPCTDVPSAVHGEGPSWLPDRGALVWVDIEGRKLFMMDARGVVEGRELSERPGCVVPTLDGRLLLGLEHGIAVTSFEDPELRWIVRGDIPGPQLRMNDGKCDPSGAFWVGSMALDETPGAGSLYRMTVDGELRTVLTDVSISNGLAWNGRELYYIDSPLRRVDRFELDDEGEIASLDGRRTVIDLSESEGVPDGMTIDDNGNLWVALYGGARVSCFDPRSGRELERIAVPTERVTSCCFGGSDMSTLFITTRRKDPEDPESGGALFTVRPGVTGSRPDTYRGPLPS
jgi:sugar lactone lactonase YvrE